MILGLAGGNLLIDTPPDLRMQLLRERIGVVHAVLYTHEHADHLFGLDDLRLMPFYIGGAVPLYCEPKVAARIRKAYDYAFSDHPATHAGDRPLLTMHEISLAPFDVLGERVVPIRLEHGPRFEVLGFRFGNVAYCTDVSGIPEESWPLLRKSRRADPRRIAARAAHHALLDQPGDRRRDADRREADVFHARVARTRLRRHERGAADGDGIGIRRAADTSDVARKKVRSTLVLRT